MFYVVDTLATGWRDKKSNCCSAQRLRLEKIENSWSNSVPSLFIIMTYLILNGNTYNMIVNCFYLAQSLFVNVYFVLSNAFLLLKLFFIHSINQSVDLLNDTNFCTTFTAVYGSGVNERLRYCHRLLGRSRHVDLVLTDWFMEVWGQVKL